DGLGQAQGVSRRRRSRQLHACRRGPQSQQSAVSRQISALEEKLSVPLFHRHARGLILTEQGEVLYHTAREVFSKLAMTEAMLSESKDRPKGPLKVTTSVSFGSAWLTPRIREFVD